MKFYQFRIASKKVDIVSATYACRVDIVMMHLMRRAGNNARSEYRWVHGCNTKVSNASHAVVSGTPSRSCDAGSPIPLPSASPPSAIASSKPVAENIAAAYTPWP